MSDKYKHLKAAGWITQFGLNMVSPVILCIIVALWVRNTFNVGNWVVIAAIILGVGSSAVNMVSFMKMVRKEMEGKNDDKENKN